MPSITDQIKQYKAAVGTPNIGSKPSQSQVDNAKNTSIGRIRGTIDRGRGTIGPGTTGVRMSVPKSSKPRGSFEGYMYAPRADIAINGSGYSNPSIQKARYKTRTSSPITPPDRTPISSIRSNSRVTDFRPAASTQKRSSVSRFKAISKRNSL